MSVALILLTRWKMISKQNGCEFIFNSIFFFRSFAGVLLVTQLKNEFVV